MQALVKFLQLDGTRRWQLFDIESEEEIYDVPGLADTIESVIPIPLNLNLGKTELALSEQLLLVAQVATLVDSGAKVAKGIMDIVESAGFLKKFRNDPRLNHASTVSDYLGIFGVSRTVKLLVIAGEKSGRLSEALNSAVENIEQDMELQKISGADMKVGVSYLIGGFLSIFIASLTLGDAAQNMIDVPAIKDNSATHLIAGLYHFMTEQTVFLIGIIVAIVSLLTYLWKNVAGFRQFPIAKSLSELIKSRRSASFLSTWIPLYLSGIDNDRALELISENLTGENRQATESLQEGVNAGSTIPVSLLPFYWSTSFIIGMKSFDDAHDEARRKLLNRVRRLLLTEILVTGKRFSGLALKAGLTSGSISVLLMAIGFYAPMFFSRAG
ncbi:hypothetical protein LCGC14_0887740 [marine sediment metagenome]|uniref:Type II secretion system protein GspF domain-containing protein n=1 Tax=marine sediment metagenome TaxID=412755 RepID=A0A0F9PKU6_9ZZZZ